MSETRATWTTAYINNLPDSSFLYIEGGGKKDPDGKTVPRSLRHFPYKDAAGNVDLPHLRNALARIPQSNLPQNVKDRAAAKARRILQQETGGRAGRPTGEYRAQPSGYELRDDGADMPTLVGHLAVFNEWTEINSRMEGHFLERISPTAFTKTLAENRDQMRVLFNHGKDATFGDKPLGPIRDIYPDEKGVAYEVELLDTSYNRDLIQMLKARPPVLGSSFRFEVIDEERDRSPSRSDYNPDGIPERVVKELRLSEFGPVTFPAYKTAEAGVRSITDRITLGEEGRADVESISILDQMYSLGKDFIEGEVDPEDSPDRDQMASILEMIEALIEVEATEDPTANDNGGRALDEQTSTSRETPASHAPARKAGREKGRLPDRRNARYKLNTKERPAPWHLT